MLANPIFEFYNAMQAQAKGDVHLSKPLDDVVGVLWSAKLEFIDVFMSFNYDYARGRLRLALLFI